MQWIFATILLSLGIVWCQELPEYLQFVKEKIDPFVSIEEIQSIMRSKCKRNGGDEAFNNLKLRVSDLEEFLYLNFNVSQIKEEIEVVRSTQEFGIVFKKYCDRAPTAQELVRSVFAAAEICIEDEEKPSLKLFLNITNTVATTVCYNEGDRLSMFMEDGGPECMFSQKDDLEQCANETLHHHFHPGFSYNSLFWPPENITEGCGSVAKVRTCVVKALEKCEDISTAIMVGALFSIIRRILPCTSKIAL